MMGWKRRTLLSLLGGGGTAALCARLAPAQLRDRVRRVGVLTALGANPQVEARLRAFRDALRQFGWNDGDNLHLDVRSANTANDARDQAAQLAALAPDVILATGAASVERLLQATHTVPIVFAIVPDPVGAGIVDNLSRPGGNATGFMQFEYSLCAKWPELLKEIAPTVTRMGVLRDAAITAGVGQFAVIQSVAPSLRVEATPIAVDDPGEIERAIAAFARSPNGGLILTASGLGFVHHDLIIALAARHKLPAIYSNSEYAAAGALICYGVNFVDQFRRAAGYVDRILKGERPGDLPVQAPDKYELIVNLKTAKTLGLTVPQSLLTRADEVIE